MITQNKTQTHEVLLSDLSIRVEERGSGRPIVLLHGGAGPTNLAPFADALAEHARVIVPTHPGFMGTPRPAWLDNVADLAITYGELFEKLELRDVVVIGTSLGGWIAAELALRAPERIARIVLMNGVGVQVEGHPIADARTLSPAEMTKLAFHDPARYGIDVSKLAPPALAMMGENRKTLAIYGGEPMSDPKLLRRLQRVQIPALIIWGESDGIADVEYGRAFANGFRRGRFVPLKEAGHFPHVEQAAQTQKLIEEFAAAPM